MSRCQHTKGKGKVTIREVMHETIEWDLRDGKVVSSAHWAGDMEEIVLVTCKDCGFQQMYNRYSKTLPQWVAALIDRFENYAREDEEEEQRRLEEERQAKGLPRWSLPA